MLRPGLRRLHAARAGARSAHVATAKAASQRRPSGEVASTSGSREGQGLSARYRRPLGSAPALMLAGWFGMSVGTTADQAPAALCLTEAHSVLFTGMRVRQSSTCGKPMRASAGPTVKCVRS